MAVSAERPYQERASAAGSSDPHFRGDATRWNPEQLLVVSLSQCHLLWYLHLAAEAGVVVVAYHDAAVGHMSEDGGAGAFTDVVNGADIRVFECRNGLRLTQ